MSGVRHLEVTAGDDGQRLDRWMKKHVPEIGFAQLQKLMRKGAVRLDGKRVKGSERVTEGQVVRIPPFAESAQHAAPRSPRLSDADVAEARSWILYEDADVIAINKPPGLPTQGGTGQTRHLDGLLDAFAQNGERPKLVHRLDKDTSGVLLLARNRRAAEALAKGFKSKETDKRYWALVAGMPERREGRIAFKMEKAPVRGAEKMVRAEDGKHSITDYEVIDHAGTRAAWLALKPHTGRTHQLRLHCAEIDCPIVGDGKYGGQEAYLTGSISKKLHLHARHIRFRLPSGAMKLIWAPAPPHMSESFKTLGFDEADYEDPFAADMGY